jgi:hypothetical protein
MANVLINDQYLTDIANAIREKSSTTGTYTTKQMANAIRSIPVEGFSADDIALENWRYEKDIYLKTAEDASDKWTGSIDLESISGDNLKNGNFNNCINLVSFSSGADWVNATFIDCTKLKDVGSSPFYLTDACFEDTKIKKIKVYNVKRVTSYPYHISTPFANCANLEKVDFQNALTVTDWYISDLFDENCTKLETLIFRDLTQMTKLQWYGMGEIVPYFYVPSSMYDAYFESTNQTAIKNHLRRIEDYPDICNWEEA